MIKGILSRPKNYGWQVDSSVHSKRDGMLRNHLSGLMEYSSVLCAVTICIDIDYQQVILMYIQLPILNQLTWLLCCNIVEI